MTDQTDPAAGFKMPEATAEHRWLARMAGTWTMPGHGLDGWTETVRPIGDLWIVNEGQGEMMPGCGQHTTIMTLGYDPAKGKFVGTFIGSMMTYLWVYEGSLDGDRLVLDAVGPDMTGSGMKRYRDTVELLPDGTRSLRSEIETEDGWKEFMQASYQRV